MASDNFFNRMYLTTSNVLLYKNEDMEKLYDERIAGRLVGTAESCRKYDAACVGIVDTTTTAIAADAAFKPKEKFNNFNGGSLYDNF
jgi:hypothetical protein